MQNRLDYHVLDSLNSDLVYSAPFYTPFLITVISVQALKWMKTNLRPIFFFKFPSREWQSIGCTTSQFGFPEVKLTLLRVSRFHWDSTTGQNNYEKKHILGHGLGCRGKH